MAKLIIRREGFPDRDADLLPTNSIGRLKGCTVQLEDPQISRIHALINKVDKGFLFRDQGSLNGTHLNGKKLETGEEVLLKDGDVLSVQCFTLTLDLNHQRASGVDHTATIGEDLEKPPTASILLSHLLEDRSEMSVWSKGEVNLRVADIIDESHDAKTFRLVGKEDVLFSYKPGQFITLSVEIEGKTVKRSYSLSSSPSRPHTMELTIKRVPGGLVSNWMADNVCLGDEFTVRGPAGKFSCFNYPSRKIMCIAGGSGITPIMSMLRWIVDTTADVEVTLLYSGRSPHDFIFRKELETISARHSGLRVVFTVTSKWNGTESWTGLTGRINKDMIKLVAPDILDRHVFLCGPKPFSDAISNELKELDYPIANLHKESFGGARVAKGTKVAPKKPAEVAPPVADVAAPGEPAKSEAPADIVIDKEREVQAAPAPVPVPAPTPEPEVSSAPAGFKVGFKESEIEAVVEEGQFLLDVAEAQGVEINYACREGSCGCCITKLLSGTVEMEENELSDEDRDAGMIYACVSRATSDVSLEA
ncbi:MAG: FHA domain-containing protein [Planctomycetota bacterium]|nr:FHA domain-containing protein [Planctomycetota bacterium]